MDTPNSPILIGINARLFPINWRPAVQEVAFALAHGFSSIQFPGQERGLDAGRLGSPVGNVGVALSDAGITPVMEIVVRIGASGHTLSGMTPVDVLKANLPAITALGCRYVHWHLALNELLDGSAIRMLEQRLVPHCALGVKIADAHGFRLSIEHNESALGLFASAQSCAALLAAVPGLGLVMDLNHTEPEQLADYLALTPRMTALHVSDTPLPETNHHLPLGMGTIDFLANFRELCRRGFIGPAILEIGGVPKSGGFGRDTDEALIDSGRRLRSVIAAAYLTDSNQEE